MKQLIDACYFCTTPYQILGAISLVTEKGQKADLYIIGQFSTFEDIARRIEQSGIFRKVITINEQQHLKRVKSINNKLLRRILMSTFYFKVKKFGESLLDTNVRYKRMYLTSQSFIIRLIYFYLLKFYPDTQFAYFDDGVGSYYNSTLFKTRVMDKFIRILLFGTRALDDDFPRILYKPQLYNPGHNKQNSTVMSMPKLDTSKISKDKINYIFKFQSSDIIAERIIIFDTLKEELYGIKGAERLDSFYKMIYSYFDNKDVIVKSHPRYKEKKDNGFRYYNNFEIPSEMICLNMNIEQSILVTTASTAVLTPKFLFDREPIVILLYRLMENFYPIDRDQNMFFESVKQTYIEKDRFFIPKDENEFIDVLKRIALATTGTTKTQDPNKSF